ncbi:hypothetical protein P280DRAFT_116737 [Massarina eburnea CBS 473.64]|uniref:Uncharacterized protein n=1 Tax=Massarina eburnea CBS 473.64 TaxID=1395130 RepID=A0A6A6SBR7_9PLEO|nr:hypothetical protein P280DRAFT_116737 [Massarina eburnea CBS 473.64]
MANYERISNLFTELAHEFRRISTQSSTTPSTPFPAPRHVTPNISPANRYDSPEHEATHRNILAHAMNEGSVTTRTDRLEPLAHARLNIPIPGFPETVAQIESMKEARICAVLAALGCTVDGDMAQRRRRLRARIGCGRFN